MVSGGKQFPLAAQRLEQRETLLLTLSVSKVEIVGEIIVALRLGEPVACRFLLGNLFEFGKPSIASCRERCGNRTERRIAVGYP